ALIRTGDRFKWQEVPLLAAFNHVITYLLEFDLYVDATVSQAPFEALPVPLRGRAVLVGGDAQLQAAVRQTPPVDASRDRETSFTTAVVAEDGSITGTTRLSAHGAQDAMMRTALTMIPEQMLPQL